MKNVNVIERMQLETDTRVAVIGGGALGATAAVELAKLNIGRVELFDEGKDSTCDAAGAQFLPLAVGENPTLDPIEQQLLPIEISYFPCVMQGFAESQQYYEARSLEKDSGITKVQLMELSGPAMNLRWYLLDLMDARSHPLDRSLSMEGGDGKPVLYDGYYLCDSFGIDPIRTRANLKKELVDLGGIWHESSRVTPEAIANLTGAFAVIAAGHKADTLRNWRSFPFYKKRGMSATYRTDTMLPELPMLSYDDLVFRPHADRRGITIGGFDLSNYGDTKAESRAEAKEALSRRLRDVEAPIGPWSGLPADILERGSVEFRFGTRAIGAFGLTVEQDSGQCNVFHLEGAGSLGWSLAPWAARLVARFVKEANESFTPGRTGQELQEKTGDARSPYLPRTSMRIRERNVTNPDLLQYRDFIQSIDSVMAKVALARAMNTYVDISQKNR